MQLQHSRPLKKVERSRAYPAIDLETAVDHLVRLVDQLGKGEHDRVSITKAFGYTSPTGIAARKVAALAHFGLLERKKKSYQTTELSQRILHPRSEQEKREALRESFCAPTLFAELVDRFEGEGKIPRSINNLLVRDFKINSSVAADVAQIFHASAQYVGALNDNGHFVSGLGASQAVDSDLPMPSPEHPIATLAPESGTPPGQRFEVRLSNGQGVLSVPGVLSKNDLEKLRRLIALVEIDVEEEISEEEEAS